MCMDLPCHIWCHNNLLHQMRIWLHPAHVVALGRPLVVLPGRYGADQVGRLTSSGGRDVQDVSEAASWVYVSCDSWAARPVRQSTWMLWHCTGFEGLVCLVPNVSDAHKSIQTK